MIAANGDRVERCARSWETTSAPPASRPDGGALAGAALLMATSAFGPVLLRDHPGLYGIQDIQELNYLFTTMAFNTQVDFVPASAFCYTVGRSLIEQGRR